MNISGWQGRTRLLLGDPALEKLASARVFVAGLGGVGAFVAEMLCRAGVGNICIADGDVIHPSNRNRQLIALQRNEGKSKVRLMADRLLDINPLLSLDTLDAWLDEETIDKVLETPYDYVADAIDSLAPKVLLIIKTLSKNYPIVSSMGSGGKMDPSQVMITDISASYNCRLAYFIRKHLHRQGIRGGFKVVFSPEPVSKEVIKLITGEKNKKSTVGTISYMPAVFGCYMASVIIRELISKDSESDKTPPTLIKL